MRSSLVLYAALYVVAELVASRLALVSWAEVTGLMVATALTDALLLVAVALAVLVAADLTRPRWQPALAARLRRRSGPDGGTEGGTEGGTADDGPLEVRSWRLPPLALPAGRRRAPAPTYAPPDARARPVRPFPEDDGRLL